MKLIFNSFIAALVLNLALAGGADADKLKIWFDVGGSPGESYATILQNGATQAAQDLDVDVSFVYSDWNPEKMLTNFSRGLATNPAGMVVIGSPGDEAFAPLVAQAIERGIVVTSVDTPLPELFKKYQAQGFGYAGTNNYQQGAALAEKSISQFGLEKGAKVFVWGLKSLPGRGDRSQAIIDTFNKAGLEVDYLEISPEANKDATVGSPILAGYLAANRDCKLVVIDHGALTAQAGNALRSAGLDPSEVNIAGFSLSPATVEAIEQGYVDLISEGQPFMMGYFAVVQIVQTKLGGFGGFYIDTAGGYVSKDNIAIVAPLAEKGLR